MLLARMNAFCDAVPRDRARAEGIGPFVLFVRQGPGWPFYARPAIGAPPATPADVGAVRARQRELGLPEAFEWLDDLVPSLAGTAASAGLSVLHAPLMVLGPGAPAEAVPPPGLRVRVLDPGSPGFAADLAARRAVTQIGFGIGGTATGAAGAAERDAVTTPLTDAELAEEIRRTKGGLAACAVAESDRDGLLATGMLQCVDDVAEIVGVATLPAARRRGLGTAVTAVLARLARETGVDLVFLAAGSHEIARVYARVGFSRVGTACLAEPGLEDGRDR
jgi:N-acetylglutamate synthase-like GNAT family acetyltransferase